VKSVEIAEKRVQPVFVVLVAFGSLLKTEHMGKPWNNESQQRSGGKERE
jgi:hypothetical protein